MATFRVGQRVRVRCWFSEAHGQETVILRLNVYATDRGRPYIGHEVNIYDPAENEMCTFDEHELEPILDDGRQLTTWDECAWKPPHMREVTL